MTETKKERLVTPAYVILCFGYFAAQFGYSMTSSNIAKYAKTMGVTGAVLGLLPGIMSLAALFSRPLAGWFSDHFDRKKMMILSELSLAAVFIVYIFSTSTGLLLAVRIIHGVVFSIFSTVNMAFVADAVPRTLLTKGVGYYAVMGNLAMAFAPSVGASVIDRWGYTVLFVGASLLYVIAFVMVTFVKRNEQNEREKAAEDKSAAASGVKKAWWQKLICPPAIPAAVISMFDALLSGGVTGFLLLYAENRGVSGAGIFFTLYALSNLAARPLIMKASDKVPEQYFVYICNAFLIGVILLLVDLQHTWQAALAGVFFGIGYGGLQPIMQAMSLRSVPISERGSASSTYYIGLDVGMASGPIIVSAVAGLFAENYGYGFAVLIPPILCGALVMFLLARKQKRNAAQE